MKLPSVPAKTAGVTLQKVHCSKIEDFLSRPARRNLFAMIPGFFTDNAATVTETLHRGDLLQRLDNSGMQLQRAIQLSAVEMQRNAPIQDTIAWFSRLVMQGIRKGIADKQNHVFPHPAAAEFLATADRLLGQPQGLYLLNGALAGFLRDARNWNEKIVRLCTSLDTCPKKAVADHPGAKMLQQAIDEILAEIMLMPANLPKLIGETPYLGDMIACKAKLFLGQPVHGAGGAEQGLDRLARHFRDGRLPLTHRSLAERLLVSLLVQKPLYGGDDVSELKAFYHMVQLLVKCAGPHLERKRLRQALELRSARFTSPERLRRILASTMWPDDKIARLFFVAACTVDARGRYAMAEMIFRFATADSFRRRFLTSHISLARRLHRLAELNHYALKSCFDRDQRERMAGIFDTLAWTLAKNAQLLEKIRAQKTGPAQKLLTIYKLFAEDNVTEGKFACRLREEISKLVAQPDFLTEYARIRKLPSTSGELRTDLREKLQRIGIAPGPTVQKIAI